jgi:Glycosyl transferase family 11
MIVSRLLGGLGNQLFQYAVGRALAIKHKTELRLDTSAFAAYPLRSYALGHFNIEGSVLSDNERQRLRIVDPPVSRFDRLIRRVAGGSGIPVIKERSYEFDPKVLDAPETCYLDGYWQSPKYFSTIDLQIRNELTVCDPLLGRNRDLAEQMNHGASVSLHVRRGDYVSNPHTGRYHGTCGPEYYQAAEELLRQRFGTLRIFVFSDDPDWAESNLQLRSPATVLRHNGPDKDYEDLRLMTYCKHHIVANSTFSWWGAWICARSDKIVIAPRDWFREAPLTSKDLVPDSWIRL